MDEREIEQGVANFHRKLNHILRGRDVKAFKVFIASHPMQAGKLSRCLGLSDDLAEIEMVKSILIRSALRDIHTYALEWLNERGIEAPRPNTGKTKRRKRTSPERTGRKNDRADRSHTPMPHIY